MPNKRKEYFRQYYQEHREQIKEHVRQYCREHKLKTRERHKQYNQEHKLERKQKRKKRRLADPKFHLDHNISSSVYIALRDKKAGRRWEDLLGYTIDDLMRHLEKKFDENMSWNNYGGYWHVDHILPRCSFNYENPEDKEFIDCWALENLQPLEAIANIKKGSKIIL